MAGYTEEELKLLKNAPKVDTSSAGTSSHLEGLSPSDLASAKGRAVETM